MLLGDCPLCLRSPLDYLSAVNVPPTPSPPVPARGGAAAASPSSSSARLPAAGARARALVAAPAPRATAAQPRLYRVPSLEPSAWKAEDKLPADRAHRRRRPRAGSGLRPRPPSATSSRSTSRPAGSAPTSSRCVPATVGPDGALYAVDTGSTVTQMVRRAPVRFRSKLQGSPMELHATMTGRAPGPRGRQGAGARGARLRPGRRSRRPLPSERHRRRASTATSWRWPPTPRS